MRSLRDAAYLLVALVLALTVRVSDLPTDVAATSAAGPSAASMTAPARTPVTVPSAPAVGDRAAGDACPYSTHGEAPTRTETGPAAEPAAATADPRTAC